MPLSRLNEEQYAAAVSTCSQNLIIASAGTGKTSTIVGRIAYLLNQGIKPQEILLLTFTNKAAAEMIQRVGDFFGKEIASKIDAGTFHAVSYRWLKKEDKRVVLKQQRELKTLFRSVFEKRSFLHIGAEITPYGGNYLYDVYSFYQNTELYSNFEDWIKGKYPEHSPFAMIYADIVDEFESLKKEYGFVNFNGYLTIRYFGMGENKMHSLVINIKNKELMDKILWVLKRFEKDGLEIASRDDFEDWKELKATRNEESIPFTEYLNNEAEYQKNCD